MSGVILAIHVHVLGVGRDVVQGRNRGARLHALLATMRGFIVQALRTEDLCTDAQLSGPCNTQVGCSAAVMPQPELQLQGVGWLPSELSAGGLSTPSCHEIGANSLS